MKPAEVAFLRGKKPLLKSRHLHILSRWRMPFRGKRFDGLPLTEGQTRRQQADAMAIIGITGSEGLIGTALAQSGLSIAATYGAPARCLFADRSRGFR